MLFACDKAMFILQIIETAISRPGVWLISDITTNLYQFHMEMRGRDGTWITLILRYLFFGPFVLICNMGLKIYVWEVSRCRWSILAGEPILFVKYHKIELNIIDIEKKELILKGPVELDECKLNCLLLFFSHNWILNELFEYLLIYYLFPILY